MPALIALAYASLLVLGLIDNIRGPFFPEILADLNLDGTRGSAFFATTSLLAFIGSSTTHFLVRRKSSLFLLGLASVGLSIGFAAVAWSPTFVAVILGCAFFGWSFGALNVAQNVMILDASPPHLRRRLFSGLHSMYGLSALLAPVTASLFRAWGYTWRECFWILAALPLLLVISSLRLSAPPAKVDPLGLRGMTAREFSRCMLFALMLAAYLWGEISLSTRMVLWLRTDGNFSPDQANLYLGAFFLTLLAGRMLFTFVHFANLGNWLVLCMSAGLSSAWYFLALNVSPLWLVAVGLSMGPFFPVAMEQVSVSFHGKSSQALGLVIGFGSLSVVLMHMTIGYCTDVFGISRAMFLGPIALGLVFLGLCVRVLREARQKVALRLP